MESTGKPPIRRWRLGASGGNDVKKTLISSTDRIHNVLQAKAPSAMEEISDIMLSMSKLSLPSRQPSVCKEVCSAIKAMCAVPRDQLTAQDFASLSRFVTRASLEKQLVLDAKACDRLHTLLLHFIASDGRSAAVRALAQLWQENGTTIIQSSHVCLDDIFSCLLRFCEPGRLDIDSSQAALDCLSNVLTIIALQKDAPSNSEPAENEAAGRYVSVDVLRRCWECLYSTLSNAAKDFTDTSLYGLSDESYKVLVSSLRAVTAFLLWERTGGRKILADDVSRIVADVIQRAHSLVNSGAGKTAVDEITSRGVSSPVTIISSTRLRSSSPRNSHSASNSNSSDILDKVMMHALQTLSASGTSSSLNLLMSSDSPILLLISDTRRERNSRRAAADAALHTLQHLKTLKTSTEVTEKAMALVVRTVSTMVRGAVDGDKLLLQDVLRCLQCVISYMDTRARDTDNLADEILNAINAVIYKSLCAGDYVVPVSADICCVCGEWLLCMRTLLLCSQTMLFCSDSKDMFSMALSTLQASSSSWQRIKVKDCSVFSNDCEGISSASSPVTFLTALIRVVNGYCEWCVNSQSSNIAVDVDTTSSLLAKHFLCLISLLEVIVRPPGALSVARSDCASLLALLYHALQCRQAALRVAAVSITASMLAAVEDGDDRIATTLLNHLATSSNDADHQVRIQAAIAIGSIPERALQSPPCCRGVAVKCLASLLQLCDDSIGTVRTAAAKGLSDVIASGVLASVVKDEPSLVDNVWSAVLELIQDSKVATRVHGIWGLGNLLIVCLNTDVSAALRFDHALSLTQISGATLSLIEDSDKVLPGCLRTLGLLALQSCDTHAIGVINGVVDALLYRVLCLPCLSGVPSTSVAHLGRWDEQIATTQAVVLALPVKVQSSVSIFASCALVSLLHLPSEDVGDVRRAHNVFSELLQVLLCLHSSSHSKVVRQASGGVILTMRRMQHSSTLLTVQEIVQLIIRTIDSAVRFVAASESTLALCGVFNLSSAILALQRNESSAKISLSVYREAAITIILNNLDALIAQLFAILSIPDLATTQLDISPLALLGLSIADPLVPVVSCEVDYTQCATSIVYELIYEIVDLFASVQRDDELNRSDWIALKRAAAEKSDRKTDSLDNAVCLNSREDEL